ncbi:unnamed protein product [Adineta ricciae]|uniref:Uncharacterized protein n=1 Tax=Adineta ricciae TaxID=249248 RepID=A0A814VFU7_ADIRI|nr:unnamed protein product [Adineta ricciae]
MGKAMDCNDLTAECKCDQPSVSTSPTLTPTSPLDLTMHSKRFPFTQRSTSPVDLSMKRPVVYERQAPIENEDNFPMIITQPKPEWHYRSVKDLAKQHLPFLAGNGPQRTPIRVSVPPASHRQLYLALTIVTMKSQLHPSKVIVPARTTANIQLLTHDNNLDCLSFDENSTDYFDKNTRCIYSKISVDEHRSRSKDIRVHMFNLYQNQILTKELIEVEHLHLCKLCFWFCIQENGRYVPISQPSYSITIEEKKMSSRPSRSAQTTRPLPIPSPYAQFDISYQGDSSMDVDSNEDASQ